MKIIKEICIALPLMLWLGLGVAFAQGMSKDSTLTDTLPAFDNYLQPVSQGKAKPFSYPKISQANIRLYARVWRVIDLADTANAILTVPGHSLMEAIMKGLDSGKLTPYEKDDFKTRLTVRQGEQRFADSVLVPKFDKDGNQISSKMVLNEFNPDKIKKFRIEEDVFFDKQRGRLDTRIIAIAPMMPITGDANLPENLATAPAFWLYFPQLRYALVQDDVSDPDKNIFDVTMDDVFMQQKFKSYLVEEFSPGGVQTGLLDPGSPEALKLDQKIADLKKNIWKAPKGVDEKKLMQPSAADVRRKNDENPVKTN